MDRVTFKFRSVRTKQRIAWALLDTPFTFSVVFGDVHYNDPFCVTVWGKAAIENVRNECKKARINFTELV
jgi:hypothetical protein